MSYQLAWLFLATLLYLSVLFLIAYAADSDRIPRAITRHPLTYALSLGVYTTTWSYYGSVGFAQENGYVFLAIYIGPTLAFLLAPLLLVPIQRLVREYQLTSLADLFAFRYSSHLAGIMVTLFMLVGSLPYIALQLQAVTESTRILVGGQTPVELGLIFCATLTVFAILFGARHVSPREKHEGLVAAIAFESLVKLLAMLAVALYALYGVFDGPQGLEHWLARRPEALDALYAPLRDSPWYSLVLLSFAAAFLLPRQFHMGFVENLGGRSLGVAAWAFPLFLLVFNLAIPLLLWAGQALGLTMPPEYYLLGIAQDGHPLLVIAAFIGGISAASAMAIVTTLALSSMVLNHVLLPASYPDPAVDLYRWLLWGRRVLIAVIIVAAYGLYLLLEHNQGLVQLGLISFVAVAQFLPGLMGVLFWHRATRAGFLLGLAAGIGVWLTTLITPLMARTGLVGPGYDLMTLMGMDEPSPWAFVTFWSLSLNLLMFVVVSLLTRQDIGEQRAVAACFREDWVPSGKRLIGATSARAFAAQLTRMIGPQAAEREVQKALSDLRLHPDETRPQELRRLRNRIERNLSGMLGPIMAQMIVNARLPTDQDTRLMLSDHMRFVEDRLQHSRNRLRGLARELDALQLYHRQVLQDLPLGVCALSAHREILNWNQAMEALTGLSHQAAMGLRVSELPAPWGELFHAFLAFEDTHVHKTRVVVGGRPHWFNLHKAALGLLPSVNPGDGPFAGGLVLLVEDLTELQVLEAELAHSARLASIGQLAAGVAHEIGNPVTGIACLAQNLRDEDDPELIAESIEEILEQTQRITAIVRSLLTYSHGGTLEDQPFSLFPLHGCVADAVRLVTLSRTGKHLCYQNCCPGDLRVEADRQRLLQVLVNLLTNAADASPADQPIVIQVSPEEDEIVVQVIDRGEGVADELKQRIFEPFFTTKEPGKGTGLGLPLVYNIIRDHGGTIRVEDAVPRGCCFTVRLPRRQTPSQAPPEPHRERHREESEIEP